MEGFILSHHWRDSEQGLMLEYWLSTDEGPRCLQFQQQTLVCFFPKAAQHLLPVWQDIHTKDVGLKHFSGEPVVAVYCGQYQTLLRFRQYCQDQEITLWEDDIKPVDRFMMERHIRGSLQWRADDQSTRPPILPSLDTETTHDEADPSLWVTNPKVKSSDYKPKLKVLSVDIETSMPTARQRERLYSIGFVGETMGASSDQRVDAVLMLAESNGQQIEHLPDYVFLYEDTLSLLHAANDWITQYDPDVLIGWSVVNFDIAVLDRVYREHRVPFQWGRQGNLIRLRDGQNNRKFVDIPGRVIVDGIDALKSATYQFPSFSLQNVSETLLGEGKDLGEHQDKVHNRGQAITDLFLNNKSAFARYNRKDCALVLDIFAHTHILDFLIQRSFLTGHTLDRFGGSVAAFEYLYLPKLHRAGYVAPNLGEGYDAVKAPGGFVMDSQPGFYQNVLVLDFKSLYPSIIRTFKVDPMGLIEGLNAYAALTSSENETEKPAENVSTSETVPGFNGAHFHRQHHFLPDIIRDLWAARDVAKRQKDAAASQAIKIIMNSFYGILGSTGCRFFDVRLASSITQRGHEIIQTTADWINQQDYEVIYGDTDSVFVWLKKQHSSEQAREVGQRLAVDLNAWWQKQLSTRYQLECDLEIEFENHYSKFLMPTIRGSDTGSKKRYAGLTDDHQMVFKGLEAVRSDWTPLAKHLQIELYRRIFHDEDYREYLQDCVRQLFEGRCDDLLVYRKRIRRSLKDYIRNVPPQIQAARKAEEARADRGLTELYEYGGWIEYVMTVNGPEPIEFQVSALDYDHYLEKQMTPVVDGILHFFKQSLGQLVNPQRDIFDTE